MKIGTEWVEWHSTFAVSNYTQSIITCTKNTTMKTLTLIEKNTKYNIQAGAEESRHSTLPMSNGLRYSNLKIY